MSEQLPRKPPRFPPWQTNRGSIINHVLAVAAVAVNAYVLYAFIRDGVNTINVAAMGFSLGCATISLCYRIARIVHDIKVWKEQRALWVRLARIQGTEQCDT